MYKVSQIYVSLIVRVVTGRDSKTINGHTFQGFGSHHNDYPVPYFTVAAAVGMKQSDVDTFCVRLVKVLAKVYSSKNSSGENSQGDVPS